MNTRTLMLALTLAAAPLFTSGVALAQDTAPRECQHRHEGRGDRAGHWADRMVAILGLDATQEATVRQIFEANRPRREAIRQMTDATARRTAIEALHTETRSAIDAVLTPDQRATLDRMHAERGARRGGGHGRGRHHGPRGAAPSAPVGI